MLLNALKNKGLGVLSWVQIQLENKHIAKEDRLKREEFLRELHQARKDLEDARNNYNFAEDSALLEYYIYEIKAAETRLNYYITLAKRANLSNDGYLSSVFAGGKRREEPI